MSPLAFIMFDRIRRVGKIRLGTLLADMALPHGPHIQAALQELKRIDLITIDMERDPLGMMFPLITCAKG